MSTTPLSTEQIDTILQYDAEKRCQYLLKEVTSQGQIWILTDEHGCVMLNSEDEDCVPIWPNQEFAQAWATGDWAECKPESISINKWHSRWTPGLEDDELAIVVFPNLDQEGIILYPDELDDALRQQSKKSGKR